MINKMDSDLHVKHFVSQEEYREKAIMKINMIPHT